MTDKEAAPVASEVSGPSSEATTPKKTTGKPKAAKPTHPSTVDMIHAAVGALNERGGSSLQAIKKYIAGTYNLDTERTAIFIKKHIKAAVLAGTLVQTKGKGASGSFKLPVGKTASGKSKKVSKESTTPKKTTSPKKVTKKSATKTGETTPKTTKKVAAKKATKTTTADKPKKASAKTTAKAVSSKSPSKVKKVAKAPTTKPKAPKPKKIAAPKTPAKKATTAASKK